MLEMSCAIGNVDCDDFLSNESGFKIKHTGGSRYLKTHKKRLQSAMYQVNLGRQVIDLNDNDDNDDNYGLISAIVLFI